MQYIRSVVFGSAVLLSACATTEPGVQSRTEQQTQPPQQIEQVPAPASSELEIALATVDKLEAQNNPQAAIDRLTQTLNSKTLGSEGRNKLLERRAELRSKNYDVFGAITDLEIILDNSPSEELTVRVRDSLDMLRGKATSLNFLANSVETSRTERAEILFELGNHGDAIDQIRKFNLVPNNDILLAMLQIGYLCEGNSLSGQTFTVTDNTGRAATVRFCDSGK